MDIPDLRPVARYLGGAYLEDDVSSDNPILSEASRKKPRRTDHREGSSDYHRVVFEQGDWRVIVCKDRIQWIIQHRICAGSPAGARWIGKHYCTA